MAPPPPSPPPRSLPEELVEDILLRFPPDDPARLVHAALVCKPWCAIVSGAGFRRRFREFHRTPPLLGFVSNIRTQGDRESAEFVPTCSFPASQVHSRSPPLLGFVSNIRTQADREAAEFIPGFYLPASHVHSRWSGQVVDAHHGRILLLCRISRGYGLCWSDVLMVWDPTTDEKEEVPFPRVQWCQHWTAAVLCAAHGRCGHLDCCRGPFLIVFVSYGRTPVLCTYSSSTASWSKPISSNPLPYGRFYWFTHVAHVESESALYFGALFTDYILKFDLESHEISWIELPTTCSRKKIYVLTTTEGGGLGLATITESSKLYMWSREVDATWTESRVIELKALLPIHAVLASPRVLGFTVGTGVIFLESNNVLFAIDLKTYKVIKEVSMATEILTVIPYMSFYTPAFGAVSNGEGP